ncbi:MAG: hypothetical protein IKD80_00160 [Selenomonadaceae bacterium]|nr:hypothetical protein [Selenomonadaceae bacterium]
MANEILKDEQLTDAQLNDVAGGTYVQSASDALKFKELGVKVYDTEIAGVPVLMHDQFVKLRETFQKYGVTVEDHGGLIDDNKYFVNGKQVTRDDAWKHITAQFK